MQSLSYYSDSLTRNSTTTTTTTSSSLYSTETNNSQSSEKSINLNDPALYRPTAQGIPVKLVLQQATCSGWLTKYVAPTFSFINSQKKRYVVLVDRMLYTFKSETPDNYREFLEINKNTHAFATDQFSGVLYCIEIKKVSPSQNISWYLQADDAETMKLWLSRIRSTIAWLASDEKGAYTRDNILRKNSNASSTIDTSFNYSTEETTIVTHKSDPRHSGNNASSHQNRPYRVPSVLPPQLPPPKSLPPPIPSEAYL